MLLAHQKQKNQFGQRDPLIPKPDASKHASKQESQFSQSQSKFQFAQGTVPSQLPMGTFGAGAALEQRKQMLKIDALASFCSL